MSLGLCVIGCGSFAAVFARSIAALRDDIDLYFASRDPNRAAEYSARFGGAGSFGSYADAAADPRVDALYICTPHHLHRQHFELAARHGKPALVEKPIAGTLEDARAMLDLAKSANVTLMVAENYRFLPAVREAARLIDAGRLGQLRLVELREQYPFRPEGWRNRADFNGGGVLIDGGIHKFSALTRLAGPPTHLYARSVLPGQPGLDAEDGVVIITGDARGVVGVINHSWSVAPTAPHHWVNVSGTAASLYFEVGRPWLKIIEARAETVVPLDNQGNGLLPMVREFHDCIAENRPPSMTAQDGLHDLTLVLKSYESIATGLPVTVN